MASTALAEDVDQGWEFSFAPYLWALSIDGEAGAGGTMADVDVPFSDIFKNLNLGLMGQFTARRAAASQDILNWRRCSCDVPEFVELSWLQLAGERRVSASPPPGSGSWGLLRVYEGVAGL